jgi:hypothetical protein
VILEDVPGDAMGADRSARRDRALVVNADDERLGHRS